MDEWLGQLIQMQEEMSVALAKAETDHCGLIEHLRLCELDYEYMTDWVTAMTKMREILEGDEIDWGIPSKDRLDCSGY